MPTAPLVSRRQAASGTAKKRKKKNKIKGAKKKKTACWRRVGGGGRGGRCRPGRGNAHARVSAAAPRSAQGAAPARPPPARLRPSASGRAASAAAGTSLFSPAFLCRRRRSGPRGGPVSRERRKRRRPPGAPSPAASSRRPFTYTLLPNPRPPSHCPGAVAAPSTGSRDNAATLPRSLQLRIKVKRAHLPAARPQRLVTALGRASRVGPIRPLPAMRSTARSAGSSTEPPWIFRLERSCLGRFQGSVSPGAGDPVPDFWLRSSSSERSAEDDMEQR